MLDKIDPLEEQAAQIRAVRDGQRKQPYSPKCPEGAFPEVRFLGLVLSITPFLAPLPAGRVLTTDSE
jgi:hypothetical protein